MINKSQEINKPLLVSSILVMVIVVAGMSVYLALENNMQQDSSTNQTPDEMRDNPDTVDRIEPSEISTSFTKDGFDFSYLGSELQLYYFGSVEGRNGCAQLGEVNLTRNNQSLEFRVNVEYTGEICTQVIKVLPVQGKIEYPLTPEQIEGLESSLGVVVVE